MLGTGDRQFLPKLYLDTRKNRRLFPRWLKTFGFVFFYAFFIGLFLLIGHVPIFFVGVFSFLGVVYFLNARLLNRMLGRHRGRVCPCCWRHSDQPKPGCRGCLAPAGPASHRIYWRLARVNDASAEQWFADLFRVREQSAPWTRKVFLFLASVATIPVLIVLVAVVMTVYFNDLSWMGQSMGGAWFWLIAIPGGWFSVYFAKHRAGNSLHCAKCDYQMVPEASTPKNCPECGTDLTVYDAIVHGKSIGSHWGSHGWFVILMLLSILFAFSVLFNNTNVSPSQLVSTPRLIDHVIAEEDVDFDVWRVIESRRLDDQQIMALLDELEVRLADIEPGGDVAHLWDYKISKLIEEESMQRKLGKPIDLRLLRLYKGNEACPSTINLMVRTAIDQGVYTQAELQAAELLTPMKRKPTVEHLQDVLSSNEVKWEIQEELKTRNLEDSELAMIFQEMEKRLRQGQDLGLDGDADFWGMRVTDSLMPTLNNQKVSREIRIALARLFVRYGQRIPYDLEHWINNAIQNGLISSEEIAEASQSEPAGR